ncbi:S41 family peptidase [Actinoplanes sp. L3-i22]|uniref:S41 family peptidase n=1 Tax=Actinoplanes sp. L3-i22 TaxID=2836373 RepID=UPI001C75B651|nr:S41 family peptidase [Actinoplanes sp. L3-i22]BCY08725.1 interphotoreceptor retinoid-binding protein [Actinoplanes sp. L3-i22]
MHIYDRSMPADQVDAAQREEIRKAVGDLLHDHYVFPDIVPAIVDRLESSERAGRYRTDSRSVLAELIGADMREAAADKHLGLRVDPDANAALRKSHDRDNGLQESAARAAARIHYGLVEQRILEGNVRYLRITDFDWVPDATAASYDAAARFLSGADAILIDVRGNRGGEPPAVQYLVSHFLEPDKLLMTFREGSTAAVQSRALAHLPAGRLSGIPLSVLIDGNTYSAGEAFAYHVRHFGLGELVGADTAGAANLNELLPVGSDFVVSISHGRPVHPVTGTNWEGVGVPPTIAAAPAQALDVAHAAALQRMIAAATTDELRAEYEWALVAVDARRQPPSPDPAAVAAYAGSYDPAEVAVRAGELWLSRPSRRDFRLVPLTTDGLYGADGNDGMRVRFTPDRMELLFRGSPQRQLYRRAASR